MAITQQEIMTAGNDNEKMEGGSHAEGLESDVNIRQEENKENKNDPGFSESCDYWCCSQTRKDTDRRERERKKII